MSMSIVEDERCRQIAELFQPFILELGDCCIVRNDRFGYIVLTYFVGGRFEDNDVFDNAPELFEFLYSLWYFHWIYNKAEENGVQEYEDYERTLTKAQREERTQIGEKYRRAFKQIMKAE